MSDYFDRLEGHLLDAVERAAATSPERRRAVSQQRPERPGRLASWVIASSVVAVAVAVLLVATSLHGARTRRSVVPSHATAPAITRPADRVPAGLSEVLSADGRVLGYVDADGIGVSAKSKNPAVVSYVVQQLRTMLPVKEIAGGGLVIHTTIEAGDQARALAALKRHEGGAAGPVAALASIDPANGHIVALADNQTGSFNFAADAARTPGSAFTVFGLMALIRDEDGDPAKTIYDSHFLAPGWTPGYPTYSVRNDEDSYQGPISVARAVMTSDNTVFAQLGADLGVAKIDAIAHAMGITSRLIGVPSEALGGLTAGVSPLEMADAYATIANGGRHFTPTIIDLVTLPDGRVIRMDAPAPARVLTVGEAAEATKILEPVLTAGTGTAADFGCPAAGKTGSTINFSDAWFVGYTPTLATSVWVGYSSSRPLSDGYGGVLAAPIWHDYTQAVTPRHCGEQTLPTATWSGHAYLGAHTVPGKTS